MRVCSPLVAVSTSKPIRLHRSATALKTQGSSSAMSIFGASLLVLNLCIRRLQRERPAVRFFTKESYRQRNLSSGNTDLALAVSGGPAFHLDETNVALMRR